MFGFLDLNQNIENTIVDELINIIGIDKTIELSNKYLFHSLCYTGPDNSYVINKDNICELVSDNEIKPETTSFKYKLCCLELTKEGQNIIYLYYNKQK